MFTTMPLKNEPAKSHADDKNPGIFSSSFHFFCHLGDITTSNAEKGNLNKFRPFDRTKLQMLNYRCELQPPRTRKKPFAQTKLSSE